MTSDELRQYKETARQHYQQRNASNMPSEDAENSPSPDGGCTDTTATEQAAKRTTDDEARERRRQYQKRYREEHPDYMREYRRRQREAQKQRKQQERMSEWIMPVEDEQNHVLLAETIYGRRPRYTCVVAEGRSSNVFVTLEYRPHELRKQRYLVRAKRPGTPVSYQTFSSYDLARAFIAKQYKRMRLKLYRDVSDD